MQSVNKSCSSKMALELDLLLISKLQPGQTICLVDRSIIEHKSWFASIKRSYNGENRFKLMEFITKTITAVSPSTPKWSDLYPLVRRGLSNLRQTYYDDDIITNQIERLINLLDIMSQHRPKKKACASVEGVNLILKLLSTRT